MLLALTVLAATGCGGSGTAERLAVERNVGAARVVTTPHYLVLWVMLPAEHMYTPGEVALRHPGVGEQAFWGRIQPWTGPDRRHVEAHVYRLATGEVVRGAHPRITVTDLTAGGRTQVLPMTMMQDVVIGPSDLHYGNNLRLPYGHRYVVHFSLGGDHADIPVALQ